MFPGLTLPVACCVMSLRGASEKSGCFAKASAISDCTVDRIDWRMVSNGKSDIF